MVKEEKSLSYHVILFYLLADNNTDPPNMNLALQCCTIYAIFLLRQ